MRVRSDGGADASDVSADQMCSATAAMSERRNSHRKPVYGRIGSSIVRRWCAYSSKASGPTNIFRLPYMCTATNRTKSRPDTAIVAFNATVVPRAFRFAGETSVVATR